MSNIIAITGVTSGLGFELSKKFIELDWIVIGLSRNTQKLNQLKLKFGSNFHSFTTDISNIKSVENTFKKIRDEFNKIDIFVNNAAVFKMDKFTNCTYTDIDTIIDTNLKGVMYSTLNVVDIMKASDCIGRIINIGSVASTHGIENQAIYCASKYGLNGFAEALNQEIINYGLSISTIFIGGMDTPLWNESNPYPGDKSKLLQCSDVVDMVCYISNIENRVILKNITIFPSNEWH